ncbi:MBL fold metallo-hydrolase [Streptomyces sp. INA 01156]
MCAAVRSGVGLARTQSSVAVSADHRRWFLINASPDVRTQINAFSGLHPHDDRTTPLEAVLLTDAELDHTLGLLLLREARALRLYATPAVRETLCVGSGILRTLERYCPVEWRAVSPGADLALADGLSCRAFDVPTTKRDRFGAGVDHGRVVGYRLTDERSGGTLVYLPGVQSLTPALRVEIKGCACLLIDGTCWSDDELVRLGLAGTTSREMGHLPIDGRTAAWRSSRRWAWADGLRAHEQHQPGPPGGRARAAYRGGQRHGSGHGRPRDPGVEP